MYRILSLFLILMVTMNVWGAEISKTLTLSTEGITSFSVEAGSGNLEIQGVDKADEIRVLADIVIPGKDDEEAEKYAEISLDKHGDAAILTSQIVKSSGGGIFNGQNGYIHLKITVPSRLTLDIDDGSGNISIRSMAMDVTIDDSSGDIHVADVGGNLVIDDNSGSLAVTSVNGNTLIDDGSGDIRVANVTGELHINDGSGSIEISKVTGNVEVEDGSGDLLCSGVEGNVEIEDGSGSITVNEIGGDVIINDDGSGDFNANDIGGKVHHPDMDDEYEDSKKYY